MSAAVALPIIFFFSFPDLPGKWTIAAAIPGVVFFGVRNLFNRLSKHRGITHSIPALAIWGYITAFVSSIPALGVIAGAGWMTHLVLDEVYSRNTKASGTALRLYTKHKTVSVLAWIVMIALMCEYHSSGSVSSLMRYAINFSTVLLIE